MKLLIVDDDLMIRKGLLSLDWKSIEITLCGAVQNGNEALEIARQVKPDIVLSDISMPTMDGISLARELLGENSDCMVIFLSGYSDFQYAKAALSIGVFDYILKPTSPEEIFDCVKRAMARILKERSERASLHMMKTELKVHKIAGKQEMRSCEEVSNLQNSEGVVEKIVKYIESNYMNDISLITLSEEIHLNSIYISRILKRSTGYTFLEIITAMRMIKAAELLRNTGFSMAQISESVGINDQRYFSQVFKKIFNLTPREFRNLNNEDIKQDVFDKLKKWIEC
ncbi:AraC family two component transcriptional regulator [Anaerobacterium chartisolvens]|uniref:Stage 0 sporulation protein A homolog n=1 Tax=Anaerobacterium chartisolvens TaxID=1297424 RepID=A0A369AQN6_9FIRM|nr:response regulator [Anaerobacterium chartisolvens]RCX10537.1 AraC family two component transcriptional regulator [Anaerobacterium chartisolvens]